MDGSITISEITRQHAPVLMRTEDLINCLRGCTLIAATPQAAGIQLPSVGGSSPLFAVALSAVANDGLDVLGNTSTYFLDIQLTARSMGSTLGRLQQSFGKPEERVTHDRLLKRIVDDIENCTKGSETLEQQVDKWVKQVKNFDTAVQRAQAKVGKDVENTSDQIGTFSDEVKNAGKELERVLMKEQEAAEKYEGAQEYKQSLKRNITLPRDFSALQIGYQVASLGWSWFWSRNASQDLKVAQEEVEQRRRVAEEYEIRISDAQIQLAKMNGKVFELERYKRGLEKTLEAIIFLLDNIRSLIVQFRGMRPFLKLLTQRNRSVGEMSIDYATQVAPASEIKLFAADINSMGEFALTVEHMAWVYGSLIERVLIGGFKDCRDASSTNGFESCLELIKPDNTSLPSSSVCSLLLTDVDTSYNRRVKDLKVSHVKAIEAADKMAKSGHKKKRSRFSFRS